MDMTRPLGRDKGIRKQWRERERERERVVNLQLDFRMSFVSKKKEVYTFTYHNALLLFV
jgi:hypothetical protein